jgi:hypothetical protein
LSKPSIGESPHAHLKTQQSYFETDELRTDDRNVGFMKYWTAAQIPNLLIASPVLVVSLLGIYRFFLSAHTHTHPSRQSDRVLDTGDGTLASSGSDTKAKARVMANISAEVGTSVDALSSTSIPIGETQTPPDVFSLTHASQPHLTPFILHHSLLTFLMIFSSHTQIALRVISTDPTFWWLLASLAVEPQRSRAHATLTRAGRLWIGWAVVWGAVSIVLWAGHYPPA